MKLRKTFQKYDTAKDGVLSFDEFKAALHESDFSDDLLQEVFESIVSPHSLHSGSQKCCMSWFTSNFNLPPKDVNKNGHIMYTGKQRNSEVHNNYFDRNLQH